MASDKIRIRMEAYDHEILDKKAAEIVEEAKRSNAGRVAGPIPLPTRIERYTVLRSPHADKKSREQFEIRTHKRLIEINADDRVMREVMRIRIPESVHVEMTLG